MLGLELLSGYMDPESPEEEEMLFGTNNTTVQRAPQLLLPLTNRPH